MLLQDFQEYRSQIRHIGFPDIQKKFTELHNKNIARWQEERYVPKLHEFQLEFDAHKTFSKEWRTTPTFNGKQDFDNNGNLHRQVLSLFRSFLLSEVKDFRQYIKFTTDLAQLSIMLSKVEVLRYKHSEFNLIYYMFVANRRSIRIFMKLREAIVADGSFQKMKFHPISIHNPAKYAEKQIYLNDIKVASQKWEDFFNMVNFAQESEFTKAAFQGRSEVNGVQFVEYILWLSKQQNNLSPTK